MPWGNRHTESPKSRCHSAEHVGVRHMRVEVSEKPRRLPDPVDVMKGIIAMAKRRIDIPTSQRIT